MLIAAQQIRGFVSVFLAATSFIWGCVNGNAERRKDKDFELQFNPSKSRLSCFARILVVEDCLEIKKVAEYG